VIEARLELAEDESGCEEDAVSAGVGVDEDTQLPVALSLPPPLLLKSLSGAAAAL
jgi:hypothetical protein